MKKLLWLTPVFALLFAPLVFAAEDDELSSAQRGAISMNCDSIKSSLTSLQKADSATRVHLGTSYQTIYSNYLTPMNVRLIKNSLATADSINIFNNFNSTRNSFNQTFINYSRELENLLDIDCKTSPDEFYKALKKTRDLRAKVSESVSDMDRLIKNHASTVKKLHSSEKKEDK